ncbi:nucleotidyltransferase family protein [Cytophagaceae bacterium ABcell3]|nr:nucleotidyltransferase family protein [Cytophagaceae bacterium ABcell3]
MKAMIFAAGLGTRLKPFTNNKPKALAEVNGVTLLERNIGYLKSFGINEFIVNVHHFPDQILNLLKENENYGCKIHISDETEQLLETGGGLKKATPVLDGQEPFVVMNVDILTDLDIASMLDYHQRHKPMVTLAVTKRTTSRYFLFNDKNELCGWKNTKSGEEKVVKDEPELEEKAFSGIHIIEPDFLHMISQEGKFSIVEVYLELCKNQKILGFDHSNGILIDVGKPEAVNEAEKLFK